MGTIERSVTLFYTTYLRLPQNTEEMDSNIDQWNNMYNAKDSGNNLYLNKSDPETKKLYDYIKDSDYQYELCAQFSNDSSKLTPLANTYDPYAADPSFTFPAGYHCFIFNVISANSTPAPDLPQWPEPVMKCIGAGCPTTRPPELVPAGGTNGGGGVIMPLPTEAPVIYNNPTTPPMRPAY